MAGCVRLFVCLGGGIGCGWVCGGGAQAVALGVCGCVWVCVGVSGWIASPCFGCVGVCLGVCERAYYRGFYRVLYSVFYSTAAEGVRLCVCGGAEVDRRALLGGLLLVTTADMWCLW